MLKLLQKVSTSLATLVAVSTTSFAQSPGGVGTSNLTAWFKATDLSTGGVSSWTTAFPTGASAITLSDPNTVKVPTVVSTGALSNYNNTIDFTGNHDESFDVNSPTHDNVMILQNTSSFNLLDNNNSSGTGSYFCVFHSPSNDNGGHMTLYREFDIGGDGIQFRRLGGVARFSAGSTASGTSSVDIDNKFEPQIYTGIGNNTSLQCYSNDVLDVAGTPSSSSGNTGLYIGVGPNYKKSTWYHGYISEIIFFNDDLGVTDIKKVHSYLAVKYGLTLDLTGVGVGEYTDSDGNQIWLDNTTGDQYHNDVIGIGRDDNCELFQKQSHSFDDSIRLYKGNLAVDNSTNSASNPSNDRAYIIMGHNKGLLYSTDAAEAEVPSGIVRRLEREWRVTNTNYSNKFSVDITLDPLADPSKITLSDLRLLVDYDGDFTDASIYSDADGLTFSISGNVVSIKGIKTSMVSKTG